MQIHGRERVLKDTVGHGVIFELNVTADNVDQRPQAVNLNLTNGLVLGHFLHHLKQFEVNEERPCDKESSSDWETSMGIMCC